MITKYTYIVLFSMLVSCTYTVNIKNAHQGKLIAEYQLKISDEKRILLDDETAPKPPYMQIITGKNNERILTFINPYKNAIYFYDYETVAFRRRIAYEKEGPNGILKLDGYYFINMDSIYVYNYMLMEIALTDSSAHVKQRISLCDNQVSLNNMADNTWTLFYPQYSFSSVNPLSKIQDKLIMTGMSPFGITDSLIKKFHFTSCLDVKTGDITFIHTYPDELYGTNVNWQHPMFMQPYRVFSPYGEWIYSFPVSHNVYITSQDSEEYKIKYAGSNIAKTICSIDDGRKRTPLEVTLAHIVQQDLYASLLYDPHRRIYYRFMLKGISDVTLKTSREEKPIIVIIMDEQFNYMGETVIGKGDKWNWKNSFVTHEGLNIEYISIEDEDEDYMIFKIFTLEKYNQ